MQSNSISRDVASTNDLEAVQKELTVLREAHRKLEEAVAEERRLHEMICEERDEYRRILYPPLWARIPVEELIHFTETCHLEADCNLDDTLKELEIMDREHRK